LVYKPADLSSKHEILSRPHRVEKGDWSIECYAFRVKFTGADLNVAVSGGQKQNAFYNYYIGNDPSRWASNVSSYSQVDYKNLYPGIDLKAYGKQGNLEYDFIVAPGADAGLIRQEYRGVSGISIHNGKLVVKTSVTDITELQPYSYQWIKGEKKQVECHYVLS